MRRSLCSTLLHGVLVLALAGTLGAKVAQPKPAAPEAKPSAPQTREVLYFCQQFQGRLVLTRMDGSGKNRVYYSFERQAFFPSPLSGEHGDSWCPSPSPDGSMVAFYSNHAGVANLWAMSADGHDLRRLTDFDSPIADKQSLHRGQIAFSPDNKRLAFLGRGQLWSLNLATQALASINDDKPVHSLAWSPNGLLLSYVRENSLCLTGLNSHAVSTLVADKVDGPGLAWDKGGAATLYNRQGAWRVENGRKTSKRIFTSLVPDCRLSLSPDGNSLCLLASSPDHQAEVFISSLDGKATQLTQGGAEDCLWSLDGKRVYFLRQDQLWCINSDGHAAKPLVLAPVFCPVVGNALLNPEDR